MATNTRGPMAATSRTVSVSGASVREPFKWSPAAKDWHPDVKKLYNSLRLLEHAAEFQETDMSWARILAAKLSEQMDANEPNAAMFKALLSEWKELGITLATRRRLAIEVEKAQEDAKHAEMMAAVAQSLITGKRVGT